MKISIDLLSGACSGDEYWPTPINGESSSGDLAGLSGWHPRVLKGPYLFPFTARWGLFRAG